jgi:hypothetical protein
MSMAMGRPTLSLSLNDPILIMAELLFKQERDILILAMDMVNLSTKSTQITLDYNQIHIMFYFIPFLFTENEGI